MSDIRFFYIGESDGNGLIIHVDVNRQPIDIVQYTGKDEATLELHPDDSQALKVLAGLHPGNGAGIDAEAQGHGGSGAWNTNPLPLGEGGPRGEAVGG